MPRNVQEVELEGFRRDKDKVRRLEAQLEDARRAARARALRCVTAGVRRTTLAREWGTNVNQIDTMIARSRSEERG